jgi:cysteine synthase
MPEHVSILLFESLAKYHQVGLDMVTGGIVLACMSSPLQNSFNKTRARLGTNIADSSVATLPRPNFAQLKARMTRHSANTELLASGLELIALDKTGIIESISWLKEKSSLAPWYHNTCFTISFKSRFQSIKHFREFEFRVLDAAKLRGLDIALSTSFGFDSTRLYVTAPSTRFEPPFLRVSVGTETVGEISCLLEAITKVNLELAAKWGMEPDVPNAPNYPVSKQPAEVIALPTAPSSKAVDYSIHKSVFAGENSLLDYLCPENYAPAPLVELPSDLNPYRPQGIRIFAKMMPLVPLMNIKSLPAFSMLQKAAQRGDLAGVKNLIESSSSNTVLSLSILGKLFGINKTSAIVDHSIAPALLKMLRLFGIEPHLHPGPGHELFDKFQPRSDRATEWGAQNGWFNPGQYTNPDNPEAFARYLAPDIWNQTQGRIVALTCGLGTCGTMVGVSTYLREQKSNLQVIGCCPAVNHNVPGPRQLSQLADVSFDWKKVANKRFELTAEESFSASLKLIRRGIMGGPSSGMNYEATLRYFADLTENAPDSLDAMRDSNGEIWSVFLCCDSPLPHVDDYYRVLGEEHFPVVHPIPKLLANFAVESVNDPASYLVSSPDDSSPFDNLALAMPGEFCRQEIAGS